MRVGGAQTFLIELIRNLDKTKFEAKVVTIVEKGILAKDLAQLGVEITHIHKKSRVDLGLIFKLKNYIKLYKPDIVHTQLFGSDTLGRIAAFLAGVKVIITTEQNINPDEGTAKKLVKSILQHVNKKIVVISEGVKNYSIKKDKIKPAKIKLIYNAVDLEKFSFRQFKPIDLNNIKAGVVARFDQQKGHKYLLQAMPQIIAKYPGFKLILAGTGSLEAELKKLVQDLNIENNVEFIGVRHDITRLLHRFDLMIMPSIWEGLGIAVIEAQASGIPVLVSNVPGMSELVEQGQTGYLFKPENPDAIFQALDHFLSNPENHEQVIKNARKQCEQNFGIKKMISEYEKVYKEFIK